jgi:ComEC/Rec2-related protein
MFIVIKYVVLISLLISFVSYLFLHYNSEIYFRRTTNEGERLVFRWRLSEYRPHCMYQWRHYQYVVDECLNLELGQNYYLIGRLIPNSDKSFFSTKKLAIQSITPISISNNSVNARLESVFVFLIKWRAAFLEKLLSVFFSPDQKIMAAVLIGDKDGLSKKQRHLIEVTGTQHAFAVSGQHLGIVLGALRPLFRRFWGYRADLPLVILAWACCWLVGASASMVRASLTVSCWTVVRGWWRRSMSSFKLLQFVVILMLLIQPWWLTDIGFQLTVAAMVGVLAAESILVSWRVKPQLANELLGIVSETEHDRNADRSYFKQMAGYIRETAVVTTVITLVVAPLTVWHFQSLSLLSVVANVLVLWLFPLILASAAAWPFCYVLIHKVSFLTTLEFLVTLLFELPTRLAMGILAWLAQLEGLFLQIEVSNLKLILIYYLVVAISWRVFVNKKRPLYRLDY